MSRQRYLTRKLGRVLRRDIVVAYHRHPPLGLTQAKKDLVPTRQIVLALSTQYTGPSLKTPSASRLGAGLAVHGVIVRQAILKRPMVEMGQKRPFRPHWAMSAFTPKATAIATCRAVALCEKRTESLLGPSRLTTAPHFGRGIAIRCACRWVGVFAGPVDFLKG